MVIIVIFFAFFWVVNIIMCFILVPHLMRKKSIRVVVILVVLFHAFGFNFLYVEAGEQPAVCNSPSEVMSDYFWFQNKARAILLWSELNEKRFSSSIGSWWLFSDKILELHNDTAIDILAWTVWNLESMASNAITSAVLVLFISASVLQSSTDWIIRRCWILSRWYLM